MSSKIYTGGGDKGTTSLVDGSRISKSSLRLKTYGTIDELNSNIGFLLAVLEDHGNKELFTPDIKFLLSVQNDLFVIGSHLACEDDSSKEKLPEFSTSRIEGIEKQIDHLANLLPEVTEFILPGGTIPAAAAHICRTLCRRTERLVVELHEESKFDNNFIIYFNRLSDYLYTFARYINHQMSHKEMVWKKPEAGE